jgi:hypothetical protein
MSAMSALRAQRQAAETALRRVAATVSSRLVLTREQLAAQEGPPVTLADADAETIEFWRTIVQTVFDRIEVAANWSGRRFSPGRLTLLPRPEYPEAAEPVGRRNFDSRLDQALPKDRPASLSRPGCKSYGCHSLQRMLRKQVSDDEI